VPSPDYVWFATYLPVEARFLPRRQVPPAAHGLVDSVAVRWRDAASVSSLRTWRLVLVIGPGRGRIQRILRYGEADEGTDADPGEPVPVADLDREREPGHGADPRRQSNGAPAG
jgi:hypothetical protein